MPTKCLIIQRLRTDSGRSVTTIIQMVRLTDHGRNLPNPRYRYPCNQKDTSFKNSIVK